MSGHEETHLEDPRYQVRRVSAWLLGLTEYPVVLTLACNLQEP